MVGTLRFAHPTALFIPAPAACIRLVPSLVQRGRELQTVCDPGARDAAPEENRETGLRPHLRKSGLAFRGRCNGPPQGLVCPPPGLESPGPSLPVAHTLPAEEAVSEGKGLEHIAARGAPEGCPETAVGCGLRALRASLACAQAAQR